MDELLLKRDEFLNYYLDKLYEYCNKYDNIAILNQVKAFVGEDNVALSDVYADFELVSKDEYDRGNGKIGFTHQSPLSHNVDSKFDVDTMMRNINKKIYELEVREEMDNRRSNVTKKSLYINVKNVEGENVECLLKEGPEDIITKTQNIKVVNDIDYLDKIKGLWMWIRGYEIVESDKVTYILEPDWYKKNEELTETDKAFLKSNLIIEEKKLDRNNHRKAINTVLDINEQQGGRKKREEGVEDFLDINEQGYTINGMVILSEPGGGKTTYLKHLIYEIISCYRNTTLNNQLFEKNGMDKNIKYIPIFVRTRDLTDILKNEDIRNEKLFNDMVESSVSRIISTNDNDYSLNDISDLLKNRINYKYLFIIDGFEELDDEKAGKLLDCLKYAYDNDKLNKTEDRLIISSRYKEYGYQQLVTFCTEHAIAEKYIKFDNKGSAIDKCVSKWFDILKKAGQDKHEYFNQMRTSNSDISNLITTPLELTGLIMLCQSQSALPTDITVLYRSIIEIWLTYGIKDANIPFFSLSDIFLELATIAYYMAESENEKLRISREKIKDIIGKRRKDLRRYYRSNSYVSSDSKEEIDELIDFWLKRNILVKNSNEDIYEFAHREYQSYLISYAIVNNFIPENKRKKRRIEYLRVHMEQAEDFWDRVIVFSAFMSTDLHDDIIEYIFKQLQMFNEKKVETSTSTLKGIDKYFLSIVLQLANAEGFYFADNEYDLLFKEIFKYDRINIMKKSVKGSEIKKLLLNGRNETNTSFLKKAIEMLKKCDETIKKLKMESNDEHLLKTWKDQRDNIINTIGTMVFHIAWNCDADKNTIKRAFSLYLDNWIAMDMVYEIKESLASYRYNEDRIKLIREIGFEAITRKEEPTSDCYMFISIILAFCKSYDKRVSLYRVALDYFDKAKNCKHNDEKNEAIIIATTIIFLTTWFIQIQEATKCNCALRNETGDWDEKLLEEYLACVVEIVEYMKDVKEDCVYSTDLYAAYRDLCLVRQRGLRKKIIPFLFDKEVFKNCLLIAENEKIVKESDETELSYVFEIISLYPLSPEYMNIDEVKTILSKKIEDIEEYRNSNKVTQKTAIYLLKLLIFSGAFNDDGRVDTTKLGSEIDKIKRIYAYSDKGEESIVLQSVEKFWQDNITQCQLKTINVDNYLMLMNFMDKRIDEL